MQCYKWVTYDKHIHLILKTSVAVYGWVATSEKCVAVSSTKKAGRTCR